MTTNRINDTLLRILKDNAESDCGRKWHFEAIKTVHAFQENVPLSCYDDYAPLIELTTRIGEKNIFTALPLAGYSLTSGTTGIPRLIPCTKKHLKQYVDAFENMGVKGSTLLLFESMPRSFKYADQTELDAISGMVLAEVQRKISDVSYKRVFKKGAYTSPIELLITKEVMDSVHLRLLFALADKKLEQIIAPFTWGVVEIFQYMELHWQELIDDIANGTISENIRVSEELSAKLRGKFVKNPKRAEELREIFREGFSQPIAPRIWPNLMRVVAAGTGSFRIYTEKLPYYIGDIPHINGLYASSEALLGECMVGGSDVYTLCENNTFCEFIPVNSEASDKICISDELTVGQEYEVVITNNSGFYRYRLGDVIRVVELADGKVKFIYEYRKNQVHSIIDECVTEKEILEVVMDVKEQFGLKINDYCYWADEEDNSYTIFMEPAQCAITEKKLLEMDQAAFEEYCDMVFARVNPKYAMLRKSGKLASCKVLFLQPQTHLLYRDVLRYRRKTAQDQIKPVRYLDNPVKEKFFFSMIDTAYHSPERVSYYTAKYPRSKKKK